MPSTCLMERDDKKGLTVNSHLKGDPDNNRIRVCIEHANKMGIISPLNREKKRSNNLVPPVNESTQPKELPS